jgi:hypothetical protein
MLGSFTPIHRKVISDLKGPWTVPVVGGMGPNVRFRYVHEDVIAKNPDPSIYPGISLRVLDPRDYAILTTVENVNVLTPDLNDPGEYLVNVFPSPQPYDICYQISAYAKNQVQYDALVRIIRRVWAHDHAQNWIAVVDLDDANVTHKLDISLTTSAERHRPEDNVFLADFSLHVYATLYLLDPVVEFPAETIEISAAIKLDMDDPDGPNLEDLPEVVEND